MDSRITDRDTIILALVLSSLEQAKAITGQCAGLATVIGLEKEAQNLRNACDLYFCALQKELEGGCDQSNGGIRQDDPGQPDSPDEGAKGEKAAWLRCTCGRFIEVYYGRVT